MKTGVKLPKFLEKFLNIYSIIIVVLGFTAIIYMNISALKSPIEAQISGCAGPCPSFAPFCDIDFHSPGGTRYGSICTDITSTTCPSTGPVDCSTPSTCNDSMRQHLNHGQTVMCVPAGDRCGGGSMGYCSVGNAEDCFVGIPGVNYRSCGCDMNSCIAKCEAELSGQPEDVTHWTYYDTCSGCQQLFRCDCDRQPPPPPGCPYTNTQARVQEDMYHHWMPEITINVGESFRVGSFHNGTGQFASDTRLEVAGPNGFSFSCDARNSGCNGQTIFNVTNGTYTLTVRTYNPDGGLYPESECNATAHVFVNDIPPECGDGTIDPGEECDPPGNTDQCEYGTCQTDCTCPSPPPPERGFELEKVVVGPGSYYEGDTVTF
ncbi:hypothetical protein JW766_03705, partial [Candidatus Dojkabacteria bacterium]|nr:hypothetical protein [Candidatus Dojkabacteria bacterium]